MVSSESAGVDRFEDEALAGSVRIVPPTLIAHETSACEREEPRSRDGRDAADG